MIQKYLFDIMQTSIPFIDGCGTAIYSDEAWISYGTDNGAGYGNGFGDSLQDENLLQGLAVNQ